MKISEVHTTEKGGWQSPEGETITGRILDIDVTTGAYGPYPVLDVELEDGTVSVHAFHDQLRRKLASRGAQVGETVSITCTGRAGNGTATDAYLYDVQVGDQPKRFDYDALQYTAEPVKRPKRETVPPSDVPNDFPGYGQPPQPESETQEGGDDVPF